MDNNEQINKLLTLQDIFKNRFFSIPDYQRGYSWEDKQVEAILSDIEHLMKSNYIHYTGTIVATRKNDTTYDIVDGQQRELLPINPNFNLQPAPIKQSLVVS